jgi:hypothetical protein
MGFDILWHPPHTPEERKKAQWESIIRFELGEGPADLQVSLRFAEDRQRWRVYAASPRAGAEHAAACRARVVDALRATGKPVD